MTDDSGWMNRRNTDPETSHWAAREIDEGHLLLVRGFMAAHDRPEGWTYGEVWDATTGIENPVEVRRRMSDLHRDGFLCWVTDALGQQVKRAWPRTGRPQGAQRLYRAELRLVPPVTTIHPGHRAMVVTWLGDLVPWLRSNGEPDVARLIERAARKLGEGT